MTPVSQELNIHWQVAPQADLRWRIWDGETVVFHPRSGDMHILNPIAATALELLQSQPASCAQIITHVSDLLSLDADGDLTRQMEQCLSDFHELGLIEPAHAGE